MTREEKQKTIDALKISAPVMAVTQEEFNDYIHTLNHVMDWLEKEPKIDVLDKIRAEIDAHREKLKIMADDDWYAGKIRGYDCAIEIIDKYKAESEVQDATCN